MEKRQKEAVVLAADEKTTEGDEITAAEKEMVKK